ncbi:cytochrome P450 [Spirillospora sp. CA-255316]
MAQRRDAPPVSDADALASPDTYARGVPYDRLERLRGRTPVVWQDGRPAGDPGAWAVLRYFDVRYALAHAELFAPEPGEPRHGPVTGASGDPDLMIDMEPPARSLVARMRAEEPADFVGEVVAELPETLRNTLAGGVYALLRTPEQYARLRAAPGDDDLLDAAVEETLRWWTPVMRVRRVVLRATSMGGVPLLPGERVSLWLTAANHDEEAFPEPGRFVPDRFLPASLAAERPQATGPVRPHLCFGHGAHACLGGTLARVHLRAMLSALLDRPGLLVPAGEPVRLRSSSRHGFERLPVRWTAGA